MEITAIDQENRLQRRPRGDQDSETLPEIRSAINWCPLQLKSYDNWDLDPIAISPRSKLHHLPPIGVGTPEVESLSSYFHRLASAHGLSPSLLLTKHIYPIMVRDSVRSDILTAIHSRYITTLNRIGLMGSNWMKSLEALTLRSDLHPLSMLRWSEVLSPMRLFHDKVLWCPDCYRECRATGGETYDPLAWSLKPVLGCRRHKRILVSCCDHCFKTRQRWMSVSGNCSHCKQFLGDERDAVRDKCLELYENVSQDWILRNLGELLASNIHPQRHKLAEALQSLCERLTDGNRCKFVHLYADKSKSTAHQWWTGGPIALDALLTISYRTQCSIIAILTADFDALSKELDLQLFETNGPTRRKHRRERQAYDKNSLEASLHLILKEEHPPSSFAKVAERLDVDQRHLRKMFPELSRAVAARCRKQREGLKARRFQVACEDIQWAANQMHMQGIYPSRRRVAEFLKANGKIPLHRMLDEVLNRTGKKTFSETVSLAISTN